MTTNKLVSSLIIGFLLCFQIGVAQTNECCANCPLFLPDGEQDTLFLNIQGVLNDNLASPSQGVCGITLVFNHQWNDDL